MPFFHNFLIENPVFVIGNVIKSSIITEIVFIDRTMNPFSIQIVIAKKDRFMIQNLRQLGTLVLDFLNKYYWPFHNKSFHS